MTPECYNEFDKETTQEKERIIFLTKIMELAPKVLTELKQNVFPSSDEIKLEESFFSEAHLLEMDLIGRAENYAAILQGEMNLPTDAQLSQFDRAFLSWANNYGFIDFWIIHTAIRTLIDWQLKSNNNLRWNFSWLNEDTFKDVYGDKYDYDILELPIIEPRNPAKETANNYKKRVIKPIIKIINDYAKKQDAKDAPVKTSEKNDERPFEYLVRKKILGHSWQKISIDTYDETAKTNISTQPAISNAISRLSDTISFTEQKEAVNEKIHRKLSHENKKSV